jgi:membrane dipeptidase
MEGPIISSHTAIRELADIPRNLELKQIREIVQHGGLVGISFNPEMISPGGSADVEGVFIHIDAVVQKLGPMGIGIGSDFCGFYDTAKGLEDISGLNHLIGFMLDHGYSEQTVLEIMGLNWLRFFESLFSKGYPKHP